jgi:MFS family permease
MKVIDLLSNYLWKKNIYINSNFSKILFAEAVSAIGSQITSVAIPLIAVVLLKATPFQMGLLRFAALIPGLLFGLLIGILVDRIQKRHVILAANVLNAGFLALLPLSYFFYYISFSLLFLILLFTKTITNAENISIISYIPSVVPKDKLEQANGRYSSIVFATMIAGPALAGAMIGIMGAPVAIIVDVASFLVAAIVMRRLPHVTVPFTPSLGEGSALTRLGAGVHEVRKQPMLRLIVSVSIGVNFISAATFGLLPLFLVGHLGVRPSWYAYAIAIGAVGSVFGAIIAGRVANKLGLVRVLVTAMGLQILGLSGICALQGSPIIIVIAFSLFRLLDGLGAALINVAFMTYIQRIIPAQMLGRAMGFLTTAFGAASPLGALVGGIFGTYLGIRVTFILSAVGYFMLWITVITRQRNNIFKPS